MNAVLDRLDRVAKQFFGSRPNLARAIGKTPQTVNGYYQKDSVPGGEFLAALREQGISSDWLLSGEGSMYADNEAGRALQAKYEGLRNISGPLHGVENFLNMPVVRADDVHALERVLEILKHNVSNEK